MNEYKISKIKNVKLLKSILKELDDLLDFYNEIKSKNKNFNFIYQNIHKRLIDLSKKDRKLFGKFYDSAQCVPSLHALNSVYSSEMKKIFNYKIMQIADYPKLRLDLPEKNSIHNDPWHQESMAYDASRNSVTIWIPLVKMDKNLGRLELKENTSSLGILDHKIYKERPYIRVEKGNWENLKSIKPHIKFGEFIVFKNSVPHRSSPNISKNKVRISIQVRFNFLDDGNYSFRNYLPTTPKLVSRQDIDNFEKNRVFKY